MDSIPLPRLAIHVLYRDNEPYMDAFKDSLTQLIPEIDVLFHTGFIPPMSLVERRLEIVEEYSGYDFTTWADPDDILVPEQYNLIYKYITDNPDVDIVRIMELQVSEGGLPIDKMVGVYCCRGIVRSTLLSETGKRFYGKVVSDGHLLHLCEQQTKNVTSWSEVAYLWRQHDLQMSKEKKR